MPTLPIRYNVRLHFGAKGDGATDDTAAIQRAVDAANRAPGVVFFPPGVYLLSRPITVVRGGVVLRGAGVSRCGRRCFFVGSLAAVQLQAV